MTRGSLAALLAVLLASPLWILLSHIVLARALPQLAPQVVAIGAGLAGALPTAFLLATFASLPLSALSRTPVATTYVAVVYACLAYAYFHLFNMSETARRIRILSELYLAGPLSGREISRLYRGEGLLEARLDRLVATRLLDLRDGRYVRVSRLFYASAWLIRGWRTILAFDRHRAAGSGA
jgi:hypothetical protein